MGLNINKLIGESKKDSFGYAVAIGDVTGNGRNEVIIASTSGKRGASVTIYNTKTFKPIKKMYIGKKKVNTIRLLIKDINQDNVNELIIAVTYQDLTGEVKVYSVKENKFIFYFKTVEKYDAFGFSIASGDVDGDGIPDIIISAPQPIENGKGKVYAYSGNDGSLIKSFSSMVPKDHSDFGTSIACGDIDGDGIDEIIIGAPGIPNGEVLIYSGQYGWLKQKITGDHPGFGIMVHVDDINGDMTNELIVSTKNLKGNKVSVYHHGYHLYDIGDEEVDVGFGETLTTGDVNGDGVNELIVGAFDSHFRHKKYTGQVIIYNGEDGEMLHRWYGKEDRDQFGFSLHAGKIGANEKDSIIIGAPREILEKKGIVYIATIDS